MIAVFYAFDISLQEEKIMHYQLMTSEADSFARFTITRRLPAILNDLIANNQFLPEVEKGLNALLNSIPSGTLAPLHPAYPFAGDINATLAENPDYKWLNAPFLFLENYLYHKISELCGFFSNGFDYFRYKKDAEARIGLEKFSQYLENVDSISSFSEICLLNLMGNKADLSQHPSHYSARSAFELLIDHRDKAASKIDDCSQVDIVLDNAGEELFFDLLLAYWLLTHTAVSKIKLHFKQMPYFVSDALISDYRFLLDILLENKSAAFFVEAMNGFEKEGKLELCSHPFNASGKLFSQMPKELAAELSRSDLILFKGDLNYRRLVGDNHWPHVTRTSSIVDYFSTDILISRISKSEVMVGLEPESIPHGESSEWLFSGNYGQIELVEGR